MSPQPPGAAALSLVWALGDTVRKSILGHWMVSQLSSTSPPVSPELAFQLLHHNLHLCYTSLFKLVTEGLTLCLP